MTNIQRAERFYAIDAISGWSGAFLEAVGSVFDG
jgi:hypothetical protein